MKTHVHLLLPFLAVLFVVFVRAFARKFHNNAIVCKVYDCIEQFVMGLLCVWILGAFISAPYLSSALWFVCFLSGLFIVAALLLYVVRKEIKLFWNILFSQKQIA